MAFNPIPKSVRKVWDTWNLRGFIILSLSLQTVLIFFAPSRKRTSNMFMILVVWSSYLLADWAAAFAIGLISNSQGNDSGSTPADNGDLLAFWAPFLLIHLGGPDTITAFALEDNALWLRHLIGLVFQVFAAFYDFLQTLPSNKLLVPTILMLFAGIIKYAERTRALYLASLDRFKESMLKEPDPGPNYAKLMDEYASKKEAKIPTRIEMIAEPKKDIVKTTAFEDHLSLINSVKYAYQFYEIFKGLIVDLIFSFREQNESRSFFQTRTADDAYKVILIELNFMYEALYTKVVVVHSLLGYIFRFFASFLTIAALVLFIGTSKGGFHRFDVTITDHVRTAHRCNRSRRDRHVHGLFLGLDGRQHQELDQKVPNGGRFVDRSLSPMLSFFLSRKIPRTSKIKLRDGIEYEAMDTPLLYRRWAESMSAYNLIGYCTKEQPRIISKPMGCFSYVLTFLFCITVNPVRWLGSLFLMLGQCCCCQLGFMGSLYANFIWVFGRIFMFVFDNLGLTGIYEELRYVSKNAILNELWVFIFQELIDKALLADDPETARIICEAKGDWVLQDSSLAIDHSKISLLHYVSNVEYNQSILLWHIATDLCYYTEDENSLPKNDYREFSKILSDYMLYLLVMQPAMMSAIAGIGQIRFRDTCAEAEKFFLRRGLNSVVPRGRKMKEACNMILGVNTDVSPITVKGDRSKSVLFDGCILAKELKKLEKQGKDKWEVMCRVWVELLCYAASHCRAATHAQVLSKGGELITLIWMLMAHLGIGEQFQINEGHARAKLVVGN